MSQSNPRHRRLLPLNFIVTFLCFLDTTLLIPVLSLYAASLNASVGMIGLIIGLYSMTHIPANIFFGRIVDRAGYKAPLVLGLLFDALCMFGYALVRTPLALALLRGFHGIAGGAAGPATMSLTAQHAAPTKKGRGMGLYGMAVGGATLVGYGLSGTLATRLGYNAVFYLGFGLLLVGLVLALLMPPGQLPPAAGTSVSFRDQFRKVANLFRRRGLLTSYSCIFAQYFAFGGVATLLPLYLQNLGMTAFHVGMLLAVFAVVFVLFMYPSGLLSDRLGRGIPIISGLGLSLLSLVLLPAQQTFLTLALVMAVYGIGYALLFPSITALVAECSATAERGLATGIFHALLTAGVAIGAPVIGWVARMTGVEVGLALSASAEALVLVLVVFVLRPR
ncbi:MAG: MFS transporter [Chloroflexi bacterium]|nr:MFS transporter [Chloroflexota bacterium]